VPGLVTPAERKSGGRLMRGISYFKGKGENYYARPIEGLIVTVDIGKKKVLEVLDTGPVPVLKEAGELTEAANGPQRTTLKPVRVDRPDGVSFSVKDGEVIWERWHFRFSLHPQKGLTLYQVGFEEGGKVRPIAHKIGLSEMVVPYGDADPTWVFRNAFDLGEYGVGRTAHSLDPLVDTPNGAQFFDAVFADDGGGTFQIPRAIGLYERETGLMWKHFDQNTRRGEARRNRELVLTFMTTVGNYDYGLDYVFHLDGTLEVQAQLTGMVQAKGTKLKENPCAEGCSHLMEANVLAPNHQHFFGFRADLDVDGPKNVPVELNVKAIGPKALNPWHNAFDSIQTILKREKTAARDLSLADSRKWKVMNPEVKNKLAHPTGYLLVPGENSVPYLKRESPIRKRAGFIDHHVWFTRYKDAEQGAAGEYPNQHPSGDGVAKFVLDNERLEKEDVVLWYTFGITHVTRPEEWPIMNVHRAGFKLMPVNFFSRNPTMDLPAARK
jgi:primary-amine oxidase